MAWYIWKLEVNLLAKDMLAIVGFVHTQDVTYVMLT